VGFVSDEQVKSLIQNCKAFIYPSIYDGFGIPPLEALSQGAKVICSCAACLPEVNRNSVHFIDPYETDVDIEKILSEKIDDAEEVLNRYSWEKSGHLFYHLLRKQK
jgi:glycosyltransferase involved in cell wall biosynthesis